MLHVTPYVQGWKNIDQGYSSLVPWPSYPSIWRLQYKRRGRPGKTDHVSWHSWTSGRCVEEWHIPSVAVQLWCSFLSTRNVTNTAWWVGGLRLRSVVHSRFFCECTTPPHTTQQPEVLWTEYSSIVFFSPCFSLMFCKLDLSQYSHHKKWSLHFATKKQQHCKNKDFVILIVSSDLLHPPAENICWPELHIMSQSSPGKV